MTAIVGILLGDEPAIHDMILCKGHAGFKPCCLCINVILHAFFDAVLHGSVAVPTSCLKNAEIKFHSDATVLAILNRLQVASAKALNELQLVHGFTYCEKSLLTFGHVLPVSTIMFDWFHVYLVGGLLDNEFGQCMLELRQFKQTTYAVLHDYILRWKWPKTVGSAHHLSDLFPNKYSG